MAGPSALTTVLLFSQQPGRLELLAGVVVTAWASQINFNYWKDHFTDSHHGGRIETLSDEVWRAKVGADGSHEASRLAEKLLAASAGRAAGD